MSSKDTFHIIIQHDINYCKFGNIFQLVVYNFFFFPNGCTFIKKKNPLGSIFGLAFMQ